MSNALPIEDLSKLTWNILWLSITLLSRSAAKSKNSLCRVFGDGVQL